MRVNNDKKDLIILDNCTAKIKDLKGEGAFSNAEFVRNIQIGLPQEAPDSQIIEKATYISKTNKYRYVVVITTDKGRDGDKTLTTPHSGIGVVYSTNNNLPEKLKNNIKDLKNTINWYTKIFPNKIEKMKKDKTGMLRKHVRKT